MHHGYVCGKEPTASQQARQADHRNDAEFDLLLIRMAWNPRIGQAQRRFARLSVLKHDGFIGDTAVAGGALKRVPKGAGRFHDVIQQSKIATVEFFSKVKAKKIVFERFGSGLKKRDLVSGVDSLFGIVRSDRWSIQRRTKAAPI